MRTALSMIFALALPMGEATALSCMPPNVQMSFNWWVDAPDQYYVGVGTLTAMEPLPAIPQADPLMSDGAPSSVSARYWFSGYLLGNGVQTPFARDVVVEVSRAASWWGAFPQNGQHGLMPLKRLDDGTITLNIGACPGTIYDASVEPIVTQCMAAGRCPEPG